MKYNNKKYLKIKAIKKDMSQLFDDSAKLVPFTNVKVTSIDDIKPLSSLGIKDKLVIAAISKGKGYAGVMKRWGFSGGPATHGSEFFRAPGSCGVQGQGRILKGKKMPGRLGGQKVTYESYFLGVDEENGIVRIKGGIPGGYNSKLDIFIKNS